MHNQDKALIAFCKFALGEGKIKGVSLGVSLGVKHFGMVECFWDKLSQKTQNNLLEVGELKSFAADELIYDEDDMYASLNIILSGEIQFSKTQPNGHIVKFSQNLVGSVFGHSTVFLDTPRLFKAVSLEPSKILRINRTQTQKMFARDTAFAMAIVQNFSEIVEHGLFTITDIVNPNPLSRVVKSLLERQKHSDPWIKTTQSQLGNESGLSRLQTHRALKELQERNIISLAYGRLKVENQSALESLALED